MGPEEVYEVSDQVALCLIHGMGRVQLGYQEKLFAQIQKNLGPIRNRLEMAACFWAPILEQRQDATWQAMEPGAAFSGRWRRLRHWIAGALGDPVSYLSGFHCNHGTDYRLIHECLRDTLEGLEARVADPNATPLVIVAHSLGSVIACNYLWDEQAGSGVGRTAFERGETLCGLVTYGSSIPLFFPPRGSIECIRFPPAGVPASLRELGRWINVYADADILGYPLAKVWDITNGTVIEDKKLGGCCGPPWWTPLCHVHYDRSSAFARIIADQVRRLL